MLILNCLLSDFQFGVECSRHRSGGAADRGGFRHLDDDRGVAGGGILGDGRYADSAVTLLYH